MAESTQTLPQLIEQLITVNGNRDFLRFEDKSYGYEDINLSAARSAEGIGALGVGKGDKVGLMMDNCPEYLFTWFGLAMIGAVEVPINTAHKGTLLRYMLLQSECKLLVIETKYLQQLEMVIDELPLLQQVVVLGEHTVTQALPNLIDYCALTDNGGNPRRVITKPDDPLAIMFTSGTTGPSKGAVIPHHYPISMAEIVAACADYSESDCLYNALPLFHGNAQFLSTAPALLSGARMVLGRRFSAGQFWQDVREYGCTEFNYIGGIIPILMKAMPAASDAANPLRVMVGAGAPPDLSSEFETRFGVKLIEAYGMSEIGVPITNTLAKRKLGTCGYQNPDYDVLLIDDDGLEVDAGRPGELLVRPHKRNTMMLEYYRMPEKTIEAWQNLWFHTGDYLMRDADGFFSFVDRKKDALRRRGENISSYEVEREINQHPAVLESAALAVSSELGEDEVMVVVCLKDDQLLLPSDLLDYCMDKMAHFMVPRYVRIVDVMPKTPTERIQKYQLRDEGITADTFDREKAK